MEQKTDELLEAILYEYPHLLDRSFIRSRSEAEALYQEGFRSCKEVFARLQTNNEISPELGVLLAPLLEEQ